MTEQEHDKFIEHQSKAGKRGGASKSERKRVAARENAAKARAARYRPSVLAMPIAPIITPDAIAPINPPIVSSKPQPILGTPPKPREEG